MEWLHDKNDYEREQWSCEYCKKRKLVRKRNCGNQYPEEGYILRLPVYGIIQSCPISAIDKLSYNLYTIVKECNMVGMGGGLLRPSLFFSEANYYFEARNIVLAVSSKFDNIRSQKNKKDK